MVKIPLALIMAKSGEKSANSGKRLSKGVSHIRKRDGRLFPFDQKRIFDAIFRAAQSIGGNDRERAHELSMIVTSILDERYGSKRIPSVEEIQDIVEAVLMKEGHAKTAKAYILYRQKRAEERARRLGMFGGKELKAKLSINALTVLRERYLRKDMSGAVVETPDEMFERVAFNVAKADKKYDPKANVEATAAVFLRMMSDLEFLPNSPTLMNAGTDIQQLSACFVLPIEDSLESIFGTLKDAALVHQTGGGTGFSFSKLRPRNDIVKSTCGVSSGPVSFIRVYDAATEAIKQGGRRRGANMAILRVDHPDVLEFIGAKEASVSLRNFNISVAITDDFMKAVKDDKCFDLVNPRTGLATKRLNAAEVWNLIITMAWRTGDPGVVFIDRMNNTSSNPIPDVALIESTNPCGEVPLLPYESCNLGSINLAKYVDGGKFDWDRLRMVIHEAVHFLDNVIDMGKYPLMEVADMSLKMRRIGLGVMGFADVLFMMGIPYDSEDAVKIGERIMKFVDDESKNASEGLAKKRGSFPLWSKSIYSGKRKLRNATTTAIAPTGTISMIADVSSGIEPNYAIVYTKRVLNNQELLYVNKHFEAALRRANLYNEELMKDISNRGSIQEFPDIPKDIRDVFKVAYDVNPLAHVRIQAAFQKHTDNSVSKTVNFPYDASIKDVEDVYNLAYEMGCKGVTIYRDRSREAQVLGIELERTGITPEKRRIAKEKALEKCPECDHELTRKEGCAECESCGYSVCMD